MKKELWKVHHDKASLAEEIVPPSIEWDLSVFKNKTDLQLQVSESCTLAGTTGSGSRLSVSAFP